MQKSFLKKIRFLFLMVITSLLISCYGTRYQGPPSDHFDGYVFYNKGEKNKPKHPWYDLYVMWEAILQNPWPESSPKWQ